MPDLETFLTKVKDNPTGPEAQHFDYLLATKGMGWKYNKRNILWDRAIGYNPSHYVVGEKPFVDLVKGHGLTHRDVLFKDQWQPRTDLNQVAELVNGLSPWWGCNGKCYFELTSGEELGLYPYIKGPEHDAMQCFKYLHTIGKISIEEFASYV